MMPGFTGVVAAACLGVSLTGLAFGIDADRDFTGHWILDAAASDTRALGVPPERELNVSQLDIVLSCSSPSGDGAKSVDWFYSLTGARAEYKIGAESRNSIAKWEGAALLINTQVSGSGSYTIMDRWRLSRDRLVLTIGRQIVRRGGEVEGTLVYRKVAAALPSRPPLPVDSAPAPSGSMQRSEAAPRNDSLRSDSPRTTLSRTDASPAAAPVPAAPEPAESIVTAGTRVRLSLRNPVDAKHAREGDPVSMQTTMPIATGGRTVIPSGSPGQGHACGHQAKRQGGIVGPLRCPGAAQWCHSRFPFGPRPRASAARQTNECRSSAGSHFGNDSRPRPALHFRRIGPARGVLALIAMHAGGASGADFPEHFDGKRFYNPGAPQARGFLDVLRWKLTSRPEPSPAFVSDVEPSVPPRRVEAGELRATLVNHSTVLLQQQGCNILTDPIWSERASPLSWIGPRRRRGPGVSWEDLPPVDAILISHNHYDHLDLPTLRRVAARGDVAFVVPARAGRLLRSENIGPVHELDWGESVSLPGFTAHCVPALHFSARGISDRNRTLWCGYIIECQKRFVYYAGDTAFGAHFARIREKFGPPRLAFLPIGAYQPRWFMSPAHMAPDEALRAHEILGAANSIAIHHGTFQLADEGIDTPRRQLLSCRPPESFLVLGNGQFVDIP